MYSQEAVLRLVDLIYAAACEPGGWSRVLNALCDITGSSGADITAYDLKAPVAQFHAGVGLFGEEFQRNYPEYCNLDPYVRAARQHRLFQTGLVGIGEPVIPFSELRRTPFYNEFGRRYEYVGGLTAVITADDYTGSAVSLSRRPSTLFGEREVALMRTLLPHFRRGLQVHERMCEADTRAASLEGTLDRVATGAVLVDATGRVLFANKAARATMTEADGLIEDRGALRAHRGSDTSRLRALIGAAAQVAAGNGLLAGGVMTLGRPSNRRSLQVIVSRLPSREGNGERVAAVVFVIDPERTQPTDATRLRQTYGFSRGEAAVAELLLQDRTVQEIADFLCLSTNTVRFHLKQLFSKTHTRRQSELIRLLTIGTQVQI